MIKPQDLLVVIQAAAVRQRWTVNLMAESLELPPATVHRSIMRCREMGLFSDDIARIDPYLVEEFLVHVVRFEFPPRWIGTSRGVPTAWSADPLKSVLRSDRTSDTVVWPLEAGRRSGRGLEPIHPNLVKFEKSNPEVYAWGTLVDAIRIGGARDKSAAKELLTLRIDATLRPRHERSLA
jgi:hypothetical protein